MIAEVRVGSKMRSNDKRDNGKTVEVTAIYTDTQGVQYAVYQAGVRKSKVRFDQIRLEGHPTHSRGWTLVS